MNKINLNGLNLKTFTKQDIYDYCQINSLNPNRTAYLDLGNNKLTDISDLKIFKNLQYLYLYNNKIKDISILKDLIKLKYLYLNDNEIKDISVIKDLNNLKELNINNLKLESYQIQYIKSLEYLICKEGFKDMNILKRLNKNIKIIK